MRILAADASTKIISIAITEAGCPKAQIHKRSSRSQGSALIPIVEELFKEVNFNIKDVELFCVGLGPGSFTGLRASLAAMRMLSVALEKPIIGIPSFDAIAHNVFRGQRSEVRGQNVCVLFDARQSKVYARFYHEKEGGIETASDFILDTLENVLNLIKKDTVIVGDAIEVYGEEIKKVKGKCVNFASEELWYPKAETLAGLAKQRYDKKDADDAFSLLPLYIYPKECQIKQLKSPKSFKGLKS